MHKINYLTLAIILAMLLSLAGLSFNVSAQPLAATSPTLGAAASYSVLAHTTVTNTGPTTMPGDLGVSPGSAVTGFPPGHVGPPGHIHKADGSAHNAQIANTAAFGYLDQGCTTTYAGTQDLTLVSPLGPGVYCADAFILTKNLTLLGGGPSDVWIFKSAATLTTSSGSSVTGGDPCNVWWRLVSSATIGTTTAFEGNILALASIDLDTGASLNGRALAQTGAVTLHGNTISDSNCLAAPAPTATEKPKAKSTNLPSSEQTATALASVPGLPSTGGGAPIQDEDFPWSLVFVSGLCAMALVLGVRALRRAYRPKP
ncbi:MAG: ice-binding family protein [Anaerolineaceae bacterium]